MDLKEANATRWQKMNLSPSKQSQFKNVADKILMNKNRYMFVAAKTGVPWEVIGVIHYRESACDFNTYLGNGQKLNKKTTIIPKGRGPFATWEDGALDALVNAPPRTALNKDWSFGGTLAKLEEYNGLGYSKRGLPSPYLWAGTDQYTSGKYIADGVFDPDHVDTQLGCAGVLRALAYKNSFGSFTGTIVAGSAGAATAASANYFDKAWDFAHDHWIALLVGAIAVGIVIDIAVELYKRNKQ